MRTPAECRALHERALELRAEGLLLKEIADRLERHYSTIVHHLRANCTCDLPAYTGEPPMRQPLLRTLGAYGPLRARALALIAGMSTNTVRMALWRMEAEGKVTKEECPPSGYLWSTIGEGGVSATRSHDE